ncbi:phosphatidylinositol-glycan-specific phospholipase D isoform X2 [Ursus arctos]|uniref:phosphatidylinositol-glycan-specific phospholipase D isoform X2 n=1 Tax=Ursus arctos TaxID=9644 RepID=UPI0020172AB0|nr:phosphatidylinositol-glycan-specific phospholipase D isoform X2 [Ursus arctos]
MWTLNRGRLWPGLLIALGSLCPGGSPCGISTHIEIGHRALEFLHLQDGRVNYKELLLEHQDAYQAGAVFPDAFYPSICERGQFHDVSESTHWTPFLNASVHYIRENYPLPWEKGTEKLVAFLFGITSHMVADVSWHSLGIEQGFLRTMGAVDFHDSYSKAHSAGDFGGDVLSQFEFNFNYLARRWYVPIEDLLEIYKKLYGREVITKNAIVDCSYLQFLEMYGEMLAVSKLYPTYSRKSPFLVEQFQEYFLGGLDDMAFWSTNIYRLTSYMLENGTSDCSLPENPLFIACGGQQASTQGSSGVQKNDFHRNLTASLTKDIRKNINYTERGAFFSVDSWTSDSLIFMYQALERNIWTMFTGSSQPSRKHVSSPLASYFLSIPYARLGWAMTSADLNQDGHGDLVAGAPGYSRPGHTQVGRVYLLYGNELGLPPLDLDLDKEAHVTLEGFQPSGRFGSALAVLDFNRDGVPDLAVGAPSVGSEKLAYTGAVYVYFGSRQGGMSSGPNVTISCQDTYCNLGWTLVAADVNEDGEPDLVMGSPFAPGGGKQKGMVAAFYSDPSWSQQELGVEAANWTVWGEADFSWLGYALHGLRVDNRTVLLVGSPTWKHAGSLGHLFHTQEEKQSLGRVYGYFPPNCQSWFTISGDKTMGKLGASLSSGHVLVNGTRRQVLLVGAPTHDEVSKMAFLTVTLHQGGTTRMYELTPDTQPSLLSTFSGDRRFSRFGGVLHLSDLDGDGLDEIIMAAPLRITDVTSGLMGGEDGRVYVYNGKHITSGDMTGKCRSWTAPCPEEKAQYVLVSPEASSRFGSSVVTVRSKDKNQVVVAAGRSSLGARLSGALHVYSLGLD